MAQADENPLELQVDTALAEYMLQCDSGHMPDREAFLSQHPELREHLQELLTAADWIEQLAGPTLADLATQAGNESTSGEKQRAANLSDPNQPEPAGLPRSLDKDEETLPHSRSLPFASLPNENTLPIDASQDFSLDAKPAVACEVTQPTLPCRFGDYVLERVLGRGGMGVVYFGHQVQLERPVAIKMIRSGALASDEEVARFYAEARSAAKLDHPNIVTVYQCGECEGHRFFSMDYVPGQDLSRVVQSGPIENTRAARYVRDVAQAIQYAHERGILHRDLKPANVLVDDQDQVHITDFGLAKSIGKDSGLTASGAALGTPSYMSPEQAAGRVDEHHHATDVYSLGAILFALVTGRPPFQAGNILQTVLQVIHRPAPRARTIQKTVDEDLETIIDVCLQKSPERRYASARALADDLNRYLVGSPIQARPASHLRRAWYWLLGIPIVGAVLDNRVIEPTETHRWVQRGLISLALLMMMVWMAVLIPSSVWFRNRMPKSVRIASGPVGGGYDSVSKSIAQMLNEKADCKVVSVATDGSSDNRERLASGKVDLALLQADALGSPNIAVLTPLYHEAVHVLVKRTSAIANLKQLAQHSIVLGPEKAGSRAIANLLLTYAGLSLEDIQIDSSDWRELKANSSADAAIIVTRAGDQKLTELLNSEYTLLPMSNALQFAQDEPIFHLLLLDEQTYPNCGLPESGIPTVAITAFLASRFDAPNVFVSSLLQNLFDPAMVSATGILTAERASHNLPGLPWHPAAREFFQAYRGGVQTR